MLSNYFHFDENLKAFVFVGRSAFDENDLTKNFPDAMEEKLFEETIKNLTREKNYSFKLTKIALSKIYSRSGNFSVKYRVGRCNLPSLNYPENILGETENSLDAHAREKILRVLRIRSKKIIL